jgi:uncharacterized protein YfaS (alpha-2-macroglobulin family)
MATMKTADQVATILPQGQDSRWSAHIFTDKVVYRPNDVMFINVVVVDAFNKTPIGLSKKDEYYYNLYLTMEIKSSSGATIYTNYCYVQITTAVFTFKIPSSI